MTRSVVPILIYHRFGRVFRAIPADAFEEQLIYLKRHYYVTTLHDVVARLASGEGFVPNSVVLTIDDGHRDFLEVAYPLLRKHRVPATLFMVADALDDSWLWFDQLHYVMRTARAGKYEIHVGGQAFAFQLGDLASRDAAWEALADRFLEMDDEQRELSMREVERLFGVPHPEEIPADYAYLTLGEIRQLDPELVEIGSHTLSHPILSKCGYARQKLEIEGSQRTLQEKLGRRVTSFAYPNGRPCDIDTTSVSLAREAGYTNAVLCDGAFVCQGADPHVLSRIGAAYSLPGLRQQLDGVSYLSSRLRPRAPIQRGPG
jgi:peptidoglycan/xylan/chitin deacetylase (PgdA/CDA1 family)